MYDALKQIELTVLNNPELKTVIIRGGVNPDGLSALEREQYKIWVGLYLDIWERMLVRLNDGLIQPETIEGWPEWFEEWAKRNLTREVWEEVRWNFPGGDFAGRVDSVLAD